MDESSNGPYQEVSAQIDSFQDQKELGEGHWLRVGIYHVRPEGQVIPPIIPLVVELIEVDKSKDWKRGDYFHFDWYHKECRFHSHCELPIRKPMDSRGTSDTDISRLIEHQKTIAELLQSVALPDSLREHKVVFALRNQAYGVK